MKKIYLIVTFLVIGGMAHAKADHERRDRYSDAFIFVEGGVEFAVYPDGQFDFFYNHRRTGYNLEVVTPNISISYNSGHNYDPYVQYDDYGAVIQVENVPIYYDYYGRIVQAGQVEIHYNHFGRISRIGHLHLHYGPHHHLTHYTGYINVHNRYYIYKPWHRHYMRPRTYARIVYHEPYRAYYHPRRIEYRQHRHYWKKKHKKHFKKRYYNPGDRVASYHRGTRSPHQREVRNARGYAESAPARNRSNQTTTRRDREYYSENVRRPQEASQRRASVQRQERSARGDRQYRKSDDKQNRAYRTQRRASSRNEVNRSVQRKESVRKREAQQARRTQQVQREHKVRSARSQNTTSERRTTRSSRGRGNNS